MRRYRDQGRLLRCLTTIHFAASVRGERYEASVSDTLDLADRMGLAVNALTNVWFPSERFALPSAFDKLGIPRAIAPNPCVPDPNADGSALSSRCHLTATILASQEWSGLDSLEMAAMDIERIKIVVEHRGRSPVIEVIELLRGINDLLVRLTQSEDWEEKIARALSNDPSVPEYVERLLDSLLEAHTVLSGVEEDVERLTA